MWLGLVSGIVVFVVCITGAACAFRGEITEFFEGRPPVCETSGVRQNFEMLQRIADEAADGGRLVSVTFGAGAEAAEFVYAGGGCGRSVFMNPYTGKVLKVQERRADAFFSFLMNGHSSFWLPKKAGKPLVGWSVALFVVTLLTGIVLRWPKKCNKTAVRNLFRIKRNAGKARRMLDLHTVFGWYAAAVLVVVACTGLIWSFKWFSAATYRITSGGEPLPGRVALLSDTVCADAGGALRLDSLFALVSAAEPDAERYAFTLPEKKDGAVRVRIVRDGCRYYKSDNFYFDRYSFERLGEDGPYAGRFAEVSSADKLRRMNRDIHEGRILGLPGRILVFLCALAGATLPVTGFILWRRRRNRRRDA